MTHEATQTAPHYTPDDCGGPDACSGCTSWRHGVHDDGTGDPEALRVRDHAEAMKLKAVDYDTKRGIHLQLLEGLDGLHRVVTARSEHQHALRTEYYVGGGRFFLDVCGNLMRITEMTLGDRDIEPTDLGLPIVAEKKDVDIFERLHWWASPFALPRPTDVCVECGRRWTFDDCHDAVRVRDPSDGETLRHQACNSFRVARVRRAQYESILEAAGITDAIISTAPNGYYSSRCAPKLLARVAPWMSVRTLYGTIVFGWRKRVIEIDYSDLAGTATCGDAEPHPLSTTVLFPKEDVTKMTFLIHAWSADKAAEYLVTIMRARKEHKS